ncbi:MAG: AEC family transporter [Oscillospiraceae bacterium]|jgi:predicted permease|nr:AEC family transporter [Oscillospiraceae bacterium]
MPIFLLNARNALRQVAMLYLIVAMGAAAERLKWFPENAARLCTKLLLYVITPCAIVHSFLSIDYSAEALRGLGISFACGALLHAAGILLSEPIFHRHKNPDTDHILHFAAIYGNCGYMALPLAQALVGGAGVFYCSAVILTFQVFAFTHGEYVMSGRQKFQWRKAVLNAGVLSMAVGLPVFLLRLPVPALLRQPVASVASMNSPLAMLMFGAYLSRTNWRSLLRSKKIFAAGAIKLLLIPAAVMAALLILRAPAPLRQALLLSAAAPSANNTVVFAARHGRDTGYAAQVVGVFSLLSIVTMPLMIALAMAAN